MKLHGNDIFDTSGLFNVAIYCNGLPVDRSCLSIDANLVVTLAMSRQYRRYHLVLSEATDFRALDNKWYQTFIAHRTFFPVTVIRNMQRLVDRGLCYIDRNNILLLTVNQAIQQRIVDDQIAQLITAGHLTHYAYAYATTAEQLVEYLIQTISPVTQRPAYDAYVQLCLDAGLMIPAQLSTGIIRAPDGFPMLPFDLRGTISTFNLPLRVLTANVLISHQRPTDPSPPAPSAPVNVIMERH